MTLSSLEHNETAVLHDLIAALEGRVAELEGHPAQGIEDRLAMVVFSGDLDKAIAALIIATGAAAIGMRMRSRPLATATKPWRPSSFAPTTTLNGPGYRPKGSVMLITTILALVLGGLIGLSLGMLGGGADAHWYCRYAGGSRGDPTACVNKTMVRPANL
jgi:hypothetical protein